MHKKRIDEINIVSFIEIW